MAWVTGSRVCGCAACMGFFSSSWSFLVRYTLVSVRNAMVDSVGLVLSSSAISSMLLSQSLKNPILFQDCVSFCQSMTLHIELCTFLMHLQCISEALLHTLTHCVSDSACYA